jgi:hypothetical protein
MLLANQGPTDRKKERDIQHTTLISIKAGKLSKKEYASNCCCGKFLPLYIFNFCKTFLQKFSSIVAQPSITDYFCDTESAEMCIFMAKLSGKVCHNHISHEDTFHLGKLVLFYGKK